MSLLRPSDHIIQRAKLLGEIALQNKRPSLTMRHLQLIHAPAPLIMSPSIALPSEQKQQLLKSFTPLQKLRKIRSKMHRGSSRRVGTSDTYSVQSYTLQLCSSNNPQHSNNNLYERQLGSEQISHNESETATHGKLIAKYFRHISTRAKSCDSRPGSTGRPITSLKWLREEGKKLNIMESLDKNQVTELKKLSHAKQNILQCRSKKYANLDIEKSRTVTPSRINSARAAIDKLNRRTPSERLSSFKQFKGRRRVQHHDDQLELKPWDATKDDNYSLL